MKFKPRILLFILFAITAGACFLLDHVLGGIVSGALLLANGAAVGNPEEVIEYFKNELKKIDLTNPDTLNTIKAAMKESTENSLNGLGDKLQTLIDEVKHSQERPPEPGSEKIWCHKLFKAEELNSRIPEEKLNKLGFSKYTKLQLKQLRNTLTPEENSLLNETRDNIAQQHAVQNETTATEGGYLVPVPTGNLLLDAVRESGIWMRDTTIIPLNSNTIKLPVLAASGHPSTDAATRFKKETSTATPRRYSIGGYTFGIAQLLLKDYGFIIPWTKELEEDGIADISGLVKSYVGEYFGQLGDDILFRGNGQAGNDQTLGIYEYPDIQLYELGTNSFNSFNYDDIILGDGNFRTVDRANLKRYMSPSVWAKIKTLKTAQGIYYLDPIERKENMLEGKPVVETDSAYTMLEDAPSKEMLITGNFKRIYVGLKTSMGMQAVHVSQSDIASFYDGTNTRHMWQENMIGIRVNMRFDIVCPFQNRLQAHITKA